MAPMEVIWLLLATNSRENTRQLEHYYFVINNACQLQVAKNRYIDYEITHNVKYYLTWHLLEFSKAFKERVKENTIL